MIQEFFNNFDSSPVLFSLIFYNFCVNIILLNLFLEVFIMDYGITKFEGKVYKFTQQAYWNAGTQMFEALVIDSDGNKYQAYFGILEGHEDDENEDTMCDWDNATDLFSID